MFVSTAITPPSCVTAAPCPLAAVLQVADKPRQHCNKACYDSHSVRTEASNASEYAQKHSGEGMTEDARQENVGHP